jgi:dephospho-CoA kinase
MKRNLIVFGLRGSGKDTFVDYLAESMLYEKLRLAGYVEKACHAFGIDKPSKSDLVLVGTEIGRKLIDTDVWVKMMVKDIKRNIAYRAQYGTDYNVIVSDVRFHNEYETLLGAGFFPVFIEAPKELCIERVKERDGHVDESLFSHQTETNYKDFIGYRIDNDGSLHNFHRQIDTLMTLLKNDHFYDIKMSFIKGEYSKGMNSIGE